MDKDTAKLQCDLTNTIAEFNRAVSDLNYEQVWLLSRRITLLSHPFAFPKQEAQSGLVPLRKAE